MSWSQIKLNISQIPDHINMNTTLKKEHFEIIVFLFSQQQNN